MNRSFLSGIEDSINPLVRTILGDLTYVNLSFLNQILDNELEWKVSNNLCEWGDCVYELFFVRNDDSVFGIQLSPQVIAPSNIGDYQKKVAALRVDQALPIYHRIFRQKDGTEVPVELNVTNVHDPDGNPLYLQGIARNISERQQTEAALHQTNEFSEQLINSSVDGILAFDRECRYTVWNPAMERISGVSKVEVLGKCAFEVFPFLKETGEDQFMLDALAGKPTIAENRLYVDSKGRLYFLKDTILHYVPRWGKSSEGLHLFAI